MYTQEGRQITLTTALGAEALLVHKFNGRESVSAPFEFHIEMFSEDDSVDLESLLAQPACLSVQLAAEGTKRYIHGRVSRVTQHGKAPDGLTSYHATMVPWLWFLSLYSNCRIFQEKTVKDIIEAVFQERGFTDFEFKLQGSYQPRTYCVQYRESDLNFVSRLMEEEGMFYFFQHTQDKHTMVIADKNTAFEPCPDQSTVSMIGEHGAVGTDDVVLSLVKEAKVHTGKVAMTDYDFEKPSTSLLTDVPGDFDYEVYDYPGEYLVKAEGDRYAKIRLEEQEVEFSKIQGTSVCRAFTPGYRFTLEDHYRADNNQAWVLLHIWHHATGNNYRSGTTEPYEYQNEFECIPHSTPFRPPRIARKPFVKGTQTAVVVGKSGEEIWTDKYGRVKVQFHWDREGKKDENSSCWVRVSQIWAGKNWGWITIPRIGQEVVVDFLEGDPDCPLVVGRVYNGEQMPPYTLPANQTQSGIISRSSKGGGTADFNEIRLEDKKGSEMFTMHAQKDMDTHVENDDTQLVENDRTIDVKGKHTETIVKDTTIKITEGNRAVTIEQGNDTLDIKMGNRTETLDMGNYSTKLKMGNETYKIDLGKSEKEAMQSIELKVGQSSVKLDQMGVTIKGMMIKVEGTIQVQVKGLMTQINGDAMLIEKGGLVMIN